ncbi:TonB-dependent receptor [Pseudoxanthomonas sp. GM95]|uniref:TonB-dependent receptor n=1 Tax=Pseudoxanthomonas sp. GM95 TaxID=1881043 RepID=UPI0008CD860F|nr:TonB-dependent receptor [Pseudoxanthomonas sp. GM95]SEM17322.1 TonB-dependent receptor [Pseudoxanthomonas sp. GM95]
MKHPNTVPQKRLLVSALLVALSAPVAAQTAAEPQEQPISSAAQTTPGNSSTNNSPTDLDAVQVKGIRASMTSSANLKRDSQGVVDGIVAEDIGKFPDTNLAESLQRISGVSIDRSNGEGSRVTVRGVGPDFNLVLLNGRQMPTSSIQDTGASSSRAFDFANLASESISAVEVYKTARSSTPTGGIGATINIKTARPLENPGTRANVGVKGVWDTSNENVPDSLQGDKITPEVSGIFSTTSADGRWGVALSGSYQERDYGFSQVAVGNGWKTFKGDENNWGSIPQPGAPGSENITNRPGPDDIYSVPQNLNYNVNGVKRERTNGQLTLQFAPTDNITTTLDYTYSENKIQTQRNEMSVWFNFGPSTSSWTDGPVAAPLVYSETINPANSDMAFGGGKSATKNENESLGFNVAWKVSDNFNINLDAHHSTAESGADSPYGSSGVLGTAGFFRGTTTADFSGDFPILNVQLPPGMTQIDPAAMLVTGSSFRNSYMKSEINQFQVSGDYTMENYSRLDFGVGSTDVKNRSAYSVVQLDTWGGATSAADYPDSVWHLDHMGQYFDQFSGHNDPNFTDSFFVWDFDQVRQLAEDAWVAAGNDPADYRASKDFTTDRRTREKSQSAYLQWSNRFDDFALPFDLAAGLRYEKTQVTSSALVPTATGISWGSANELSITQSGSGFTELKGEYRYFLPSLDFALDLTDSMKFRASYGETIGRPSWADIQGGQTLDTLVRVDGGTGAQGNPGLKPLLSHNIDFSFEWYYSEGSYASVGYFRKNIDNYVGTTQVVEQPFDLHTPIGGAYWNEAIAGGCPTTDVVCIRNAIFANHDGDPGVNQTGVDSTGNATGTIVGQPGDPVANFRISTPANQQSASLDGWEFNVQQMFGDTGFGMSANYTKVDSGLTYDNYVIGQQFALEGLSDSANLVAFYDKGPWQVRAAYNWRDKFLSSRFDGSGPNPNYVEAYGQLDLNIGYEFNDHLSMSLEGINLTDETQRVHGRNSHQALYLTQTGPRYMFGVRYKF